MKRKDRFSVSISTFNRCYIRNISVAIRRFTQQMLPDCGYEPLVSVKGSSYADVIFMRKDGVSVVLPRLDIHTVLRFEGI